eukprot:9303157-Pyramimonas_sp.AAC.1
MGRPLTEVPMAAARASPAQRSDARQQPQDPLEIHRRQPSWSGSIANKAKAFERTRYTPTPAAPVATRSKESEEGAMPRGHWVPTIKSSAGQEASRGDPPGAAAAASSSSGAAASSSAAAPAAAAAAQPEDELLHPSDTSFTSGSQEMIRDRRALRKNPIIRS